MCSGNIKIVNENEWHCSLSDEEISALPESDQKEIEAFKRICHNYVKLKKLDMKKSGIELIAEERQHQIDKHGFTGDHHAEHFEWYSKGQLVSAATMLANHKWSNSGLDYINHPPLNWDIEWWQKMCNKSRAERLKIAGALIAAEIDRLQSL